MRFEFFMAVSVMIRLQGCNVV